MRYDVDIGPANAPNDTVISFASTIDAPKGLASRAGPAGGVSIQQASSA